MTTTTADAESTTEVTEPPASSAANYRRLLAEAQTLIGQDADTRLRLGELCEQLLYVKTPEEVSADTGLSANSLKRMSAVWRFWRDVRITASGRRRASYQLYTQIATELLLTDEQRAELRALAPRGVNAVREALDAMRLRAIDRLEADAVETNPQTYVYSAMLALKRTLAHLEELSQLSDVDARLLNDEVARVAQLIARLNRARSGGSAKSGVRATANASRTRRSATS